MPKMINVVMMIEPVAKGRAKITTFGGHARAYTPAKTRNAEAEVRISIRENLKHALDWDTTAGTYFPEKMPLRMEAMFVIPRPPSIPKKRVLPISRPDIDNYMKLLQDALNKYIYPDDGQLTSVIIKKRYGMMPAIHLMIREDMGDTVIMPIAPLPVATANASGRSFQNDGKTNQHSMF
jgi:Holliday junction resolvase RusA-like endonuclease